MRRDAFGAAAFNQFGDQVAAGGRVRRVVIGEAFGVVEREAIVVTAGLDGSLFVNQAAATLDTLEALLKTELAKSRSGRVVFRGDKGSTYGVFSKVMEAARNAGAKEFDLAQSPGESRRTVDGK